MNGFYADIRELSIENDDFRHVLYTAKYSQVVMMSIEPGGEIGSEVHATNDQLFHVESGEGTVTIDDNEHPLYEGSFVVVPAGAQHNVVNTSDTKSLKLFTIYCPPNHKDGIVRATKQEAEANHEEFDGQTSE